MEILGYVAGGVAVIAAVAAFLFLVALAKGMGR